MVQNSFVIVNLHSPSERFVGRLIEIGVPGITLRGLELGGLEDWMNDISNQEQTGIRPSTIFFPIHRIEKILLDEDLSDVPSIANAFLKRVGNSIDQYL
jgi:hypothetical protein